MMLVYSSLLLTMLVLGSPYWLLRMMVSGRYRAGLAGRLGRVPAGLRDAVAGQNVIWVHAVSVGEVLAASRMIEELRAAIPGVMIVVSTTTETGQELARRRFPESPVFYLPLDFAVLMRRTLRLLKPRLVVLMESELWPNMIRQCSEMNVPIAVVNARVSDRSLPRYLRLRRLWRPLLAEISLYLAQSEESAERLRRIGVPAERVRMAGNLKYDVRAGADTALVSRLREALPLEAPVVVCGSTLEGEEAIVMAAWCEVSAAVPDVVLVIAPRHPARFATVAALLTEAGMQVVRASEFLRQPAPIKPGSVVLLDTIGDLATAYSLAAVAFVGGSLVPMGGHNPLEPVQFGVPVLTGSSYENFREIVEAMQTEDAIQIVSVEDLAATILTLLQNSVARKALGDRGREFFVSKAGATERVVRELIGLIQ